MEIRLATESDLDALTDVITEAFGSDPLWSWALPERDAQHTWWRFLIRSALRYPWTWIAGDYAAGAVLIPPGGVELTAEEEDELEPLLRDLVGPRAEDVLELLERFEHSHPRREEHCYLSLLGTANRHRGRGVGIALLADILRRVDEQGIPAYLESTNPANDRRYESLGFRRVGEFTTPDGAVAVGTMWRPAGPVSG